jgi:hypothetical protein
MLCYLKEPHNFGSFAGAGGLRKGSRMNRRSIAEGTHGYDIIIIIIDTHHHHLVALEDVEDGRWSMVDGSMRGHRHRRTTTATADLPAATVLRRKTRLKNDGGGDG